MGHVPLGSEKFDIDRYRSMDPLDMMFAMRRDLEFAMPPLGKSESRMILGGQEYRRITWRCDKPNCWYVVIAGDDFQLAHRTAIHYGGTGGEVSCPTAPRRESLPSGLSEIEKLWREIDDVMDALKADESYRGMAGEVLRAYVKGIAFSIVMKDAELWPAIRDVAAHALKRWRMRRREIPFGPTPTRHSNDFRAIGVSGGWEPVSTAVPRATKPATPRARAGTKRAEPMRRAKPDEQATMLAPLSDGKVRDIKAARVSGMFTDEDISTMYGVSISQVKSVQ